MLVGCTKWNNYLKDLEHQHGLDMYEDYDYEDESDGYGDQYDPYRER